MSDKFYVGLDLTGFEDNGVQKPVSRITLRVDDERVLTAGDDTGMELTADCPHATQAIADSLLAQLKGSTYKMYSASNANLDPAAELGDGVTASGLYSVISRIADGGTGFPSLSAPGQEELEDEYPAGGPLTQFYDRKLAETRSAITKTASEIRLEVEKVSSGVKEMSASFSVQLQAITSRVQDTENGISTISQTVNNISLSVKDLEGTVSNIQQSAGNISLSVSGGLGSKASIVLDVGGTQKTGSLDLSNVRQSFANDASAVTISGGTVTFNSGTFVVNSSNLQIDSSGNLTVKQGAVIQGSSFYSETDETSTSIYSGKMHLAYSNTLVGNVGVSRWGANTSQMGVVFQLENTGSYMAWSRKMSESASSFIVKLFYTGEAMSSSTSYAADQLYFECNSHSRYRMSFGSDTYNPEGYLSGSSSMFTINGAKELRLCSGGTSRIGINDNYTTLYANSGSLVKCYNQLDMNGYSILNTSDERLKTNIEASDVDALGVVNRIGTYSFDWVEDGRHEALGFIAQQLEAEASGDFVSVNNQDGHYSTKDLKMIPYLVKAVQQLSAKVEELQGPAVSVLRSVRGKQWMPAAYTLAEKEAYAASLQPSAEIPESEPPEPVMLPA